VGVCVVHPRLAQQASCLRFHGGSPEPQLPFLLEATERILEQASPRICWELNGSAAPDPTRRAAHYAAMTGGTVTVKLMARDAVLHRAMTGCSNRRTLAAFQMLANDFDASMLAAVTLLLPGYIDAAEVEAIASFIASCNPDIGYLLLPVNAARLDDLPSTSPEQAEKCLAAAAKYLNRVHICRPASAGVKNLL
jgi:pyruvate formate lyase activating enzyme